MIQGKQFKDSIQQPGNPDAIVSQHSGMQCMPRVIGICQYKLIPTWPISIRTRTSSGDRSIGIFSLIVAAYEMARLFRIVRMNSAFVRGGVCPVRVQYASIRFVISPGVLKSASLGSITGAAYAVLFHWLFCPNSSIPATSSSLPAVL
ncbi:hypothetical protein D3C80_1696980 [compost metagenome]